MYDHLYKYFLYVVSVCKKWKHLNLTLLVQEISLSDEVVCLRRAVVFSFCTWQLSWYNRPTLINRVALFPELQNSTYHTIQYTLHVAFK